MKDKGCSTKTLVVAGFVILMLALGLTSLLVIIFTQSTSSDLEESSSTPASYPEVHEGKSLELQTNIQIIDKGY